MSSKKKSVKNLVAVTVGLAALIWFVLIPIAKGIVERGEPASAQAIKAAIGDSSCKKQAVQAVIEKGQVIRNRDLKDLEYAEHRCRIEAEQRSAVAN